MSCCGQKRAEWNSQRRQPAAPVVVEPRENGAPVRTSLPRVFEYVGDRGELTVAGAATGATYRFSHRGASVEVAYEDAFAMMAEPELRVVRRA